jgi:hypothetical protein|tara:strand:- start:2863 stop:3063 length:201 start_codon:yes stop_codon:yes gene_type:complete
MLMDKAPKNLVSKTIWFVESLPGEQKTTYIEEILEDYYFVRSQNYPKATVKKFYELFTKLVKKFGN